MSNEESKKEKKAMYNKQYREKRKLQSITGEKKVTFVDEEITGDITENDSYKPVISNEEPMEIPEENNNTVTLSREEFEFLIEQLKKVNKDKEEHEEEPKEPLSKPKDDGFFFRLQQSVKNQMISSIASVGSVLALSLAIRGTQSLMNSMNKSRSLTNSRVQEEQYLDFAPVRMVNIG